MGKTKACLVTSPYGGREIWIEDGSGNWEVIHLGGVEDRAAEEALRHVQYLINVESLGFRLRMDTAQWLAGISDRLRSELAECGLIE